MGTEIEPRLLFFGPHFLGVVGNTEKLSESKEIALHYRGLRMEAERFRQGTGEHSNGRGEQ